MKTKPSTTAAKGTLDVAPSLYQTGLSPSTVTDALCGFTFDWHSPRHGQTMPAPDIIYAQRQVMLALKSAVAELPPDQRDIFVAHELFGQSFKHLAALTGTSENTLRSRKRYAVLRLRQRLRAMYME